MRNRKKIIAGVIVASAFFTEASWGIGIPSLKPHDSQSLPITFATDTFIADTVAIVNTIGGGFVPFTVGKSFNVYYKTGLQLSSPANNLTLTFTLTSGTWGKALTDNNIRVCQKSLVDQVPSPVTTLADVANKCKPASIPVILQQGGAVGDNFVTYIIQPATESITADDQIHFSFDVDGLKATFSKVGSSLSINAKGMFQVVQDPNSNQEVLGSADGVTTEIAKSQEGVNISIESTKNGGESSILIDVGTGKKSFVASPASTDLVNKQTVRLGTIKVDTEGAKKQDGVTGYGLGPADKGNLTLKDGSFAASMKAPGSVTIESVPGDGGAPVVLATATSLVSEAQFNGILLSNFSDKAKNYFITMKVDGTSVINVQKAAPTATFIFNGVNKTPGASLRFIKTNGMSCTLYNIPAENTAEYVNIKITNGGEKAGHVFATLRTQAGIELFKDINLTQAVGLASGLGPLQTIRFYVGKDARPAPYNFGTDPYNLFNHIPVNKQSSFKAGRGVLEISSELPSIQAFGLLRNKTGGSLMNLSTGASGNGCQ